MLWGNSFAVYESCEKAYKEIEFLTTDYNRICQSSRNISSELENIRWENKILQNNYYDILDQKENLLQIQEDLKDIIDELTLEYEYLVGINNEITEKNKDLIQENIALQNSLKAAASVGIKPQNYTLFQGIKLETIIKDGYIEKGEYMGKFVGTAYTPSQEECGNDRGITNSGLPIIPGVSIAVDQNYWPFGSIFYIKGLGYTVAMDTGSMVKGKNRFDFAVFNKEFAKTLGLKEWDVYLVELGNGKIEDKTFSFLR